MSEKRVINYIKYKIYDLGYGVVKTEEDVELYVEDKEWIIEDILSSLRIDVDEYDCEHIVRNIIDKKIEKLRLGKCKICGNYAKGKSLECGINGRHFGRVLKNYEDRVCNHCRKKTKLKKK